MKTLFIVKKRHIHYGKHASSGLKNSVNFVITALKNEGYDCLFEEATDQNSIDRLVHKHKPDLIIVEAFWVTPAKFLELRRLHPKVKWFVRSHSKAAFASQEGAIFEWTAEYEKIGVRVGYNSIDHKKLMDKSINKILHVEESPYFPNIYGLVHSRTKHVLDHKMINIGCFGAIRPLKNQVQQFLAAIEYTAQYNKYLNFHINVGRTEMGGEPILKSLRAIGKTLKSQNKGELIELPWMDHEDFLRHLTLHTDVVMQVSYNETFNIVAADAVACGIPVVVSEEIDWAAHPRHVFDFHFLDPRRRVTCNTNSVKDMVSALESAMDKYQRDEIVHAQQRGLSRHNETAIEAWKEFFRKERGGA